MGLGMGHEGSGQTCVHRNRHQVVNYKMPDSILKAGVREQMEKYPEPIVGERISAVNTDKIRRYLSSLKNFEDVEVMITSDGMLRISVEPMVPVMRVFYAGKSYYVNKDGKQILSDADFFTDVPVVSGNFSLKFKPVDILPMVRFVAGDNLMDNLVAMIHANDKDNIILVPRITGHVINFGDTTRLDEKRDALKLFYNKVMPYRGWEYYDTVSVKFRGQVVATRRDKTILNHGEEYYEEVDLEEATLPEQPGDSARVGG